MNTPPFPYLPLFPQIAFRHYVGPTDVLALLAVHNVCREHDRVDPYSVCYRLPNLSAEQYATQITIPEATLLATVGEEVIAHAFMETWGIEDRAYLWQVWVKPEWRGKGLGTAMHHWGEEAARQMHSDDPRKGTYLANAAEHEQDAVTLLQNEGYLLNFVSPELAFDAFDTVSTLKIPGIEIRPLSSQDTRAIARALCEANLDTSLWTGQALEDRIDLQEEEWISRVTASDPQLSFVAWDSSQIVGAYLCNRNGAVGEIAQVAVRAPWRGRGIARALAQYSLKALQDAGCLTARLFTSLGPDEEPAGPYMMYQKFGFYPIARHLRFRKPLTP